MSKGKRYAKKVAIRCAVVVVLVLAGLGTLSGCASAGGSASNDPALAAKVQTALKSDYDAGYVQDVSAQSDGKVSITLNSTGSDFQDQAMPQVVATKVLDRVPAVKQLTLSWSDGASIGVYTAK